MIIDSHVHLPSLNNPQKWDFLLEESCRNEINLMVLSHLGDWSAYPTKNIVKKANIAAKKFVDYAKGRVLWQAYLNPQLENWRDELKDCVKNGACGIKLWICLKDSKGSFKNTISVLKEAAKLKLPVLIHTFNRTDGISPGVVSIQQFAELSRICPDCVMIAAHYGGNWRHSLGIIKECSPNAYFDISGGYPDQDMVKTLTEQEGADRFLYGSDAYGRSFSSQLAKVIYANIPIAAKEEILWENAAKLYNIKDIPPLPECQKIDTIIPQLQSLEEEHFCFCGTWPFWESACKTPKALNQILIKHKIQQAYVGDLSSLFRLDLLLANRKFLLKCRDFKRIIPLAILNPLASNWKQLICDAVKQKFMGGLISPYLHNWQLDHPVFDGFFQFCAEKKLKLWINCDLADHRFRHSSLAARPVDTSELTEFIKKAPDNQYVFQGISMQNVTTHLEQFNDNENFFFEFSRLTDTPGLHELLAKFGGKRLVTGSEFPFRDMQQTRKYLV